MSVIDSYQTWLCKYFTAHLHRAPLFIYASDHFYCHSRESQITNQLLFHYWWICSLATKLFIIAEDPAAAHFSLEVAEDQRVNPSKFPITAPYTVPRFSIFLRTACSPWLHLFWVFWFWLFQYSFSIEIYIITILHVMEAYAWGRMTYCFKILFLTTYRQHFKS